MLDKARQTIGLFVAVYSFLHISSASAVELGAFGSSIFQFQQKMAAKGNTSAEYKLGTLYEFGVSVKPNMEEARKYYERAANKGYNPAINRLTFLEIKQSGYKPNKHNNWFKSLSQQVESSEPNALILLGQMYRHGINVDKDLNKSLAMLQKASSLGHTEIESEIDEIYREIEAKNELRQKAEAQKAKAQKPAPVPKPVVKAAPKPNEDKAKLLKEAKRRKYEEAMRKLYQENLIMQQQQEWSESE